MMTDHDPESPMSTRLRRLTAPLATAAALALAAACGGGGGGTGPDDACPPGTVCPPPGGAPPTIAPLNLAPGAVQNPSVSFWAVRGQSRSTAILFQDDDGDIEELLKFTVPSNGLLTAPDGRRYAVGDSVRITITLVDPARLLFDFQPSGLRFNPLDPAQLEIEYGDATGGDIDDDGDVDTRDAELSARLAIWLQENASSPFFRVESSRNDEVIDEIEADVLGFTRYGIAY